MPAGSAGGQRSSPPECGTCNSLSVVLLKVSKPDVWLDHYDQDPSTGALIASLMEVKYRGIQTFTEVYGLLLRYTDFSEEYRLLLRNTDFY